MTTLAIHPKGSVGSGGCDLGRQMALAASSEQEDKEKKIMSASPTSERKPWTWKGNKKLACFCSITSV